LPDFLADYQFYRLKLLNNHVMSIRNHLKTGEIRTNPYHVLDKNKSNKIDGGEATLLDLPLNSKKKLKSENICQRYGY
jgi:hypothetical protein